MELSEGLHNFKDTIQIANDSIEQQLLSLPIGHLYYNNQKKGDKDYTVYYVLDGKKRIYISRNKKLCQELALRRFLESQQLSLTEYIGALDIAIEESKKVSKEAILDSLPTEITNLLECKNEDSLFFEYVEQGKQEEQLWLNQEYIKSTEHPEHLRHRTSSGELVRSKSEVIVYEKLLAFGVAFRYEREKYFDGYRVHPDFEIRRRDGKIMYWEHCGLMNRQDYIDTYHWKLEHFEKEGIVPWDNLIVTFDDPYGNINVNIIESEIQNRILNW